MSKSNDEVETLLNTVNDVIRSIPQYLVISCLIEDCQLITAQLKDNDKAIKKTIKKGAKNTNLKKAELLNNKAIKSVSAIATALKVIDKEDAGMHKVMEQLHNLKDLGLE